MIFFTPKQAFYTKYFVVSYSIGVVSTLSYYNNVKLPLYNHEAAAMAGNRK